MPVLTRDEVLRRLRESDGAAVLRGAIVGDLDLRGMAIDFPLNLSGAQIAGTLDLTDAVLRRGLVAPRMHLRGALTARRCAIAGDTLLAHARVDGPVDMFRTRIRGKLYAWRARFFGEASFRELVGQLGEPAADGSLQPGEINFSWSWFHGKAVFERGQFDGPVYFWRTRFFDDASFDDVSFNRDATFMGKQSEVCLSRDEVGWSLFDALGGTLLRYSDDETQRGSDGVERASFAHWREIPGRQELRARMEALNLAPDQRQHLERLFAEHCGPMFAKSASFQRLRIEHAKRVKMMAVSATSWTMLPADADAIAFVDADDKPVPSKVGLGRPYARVFISYGGPDRAVAERFNRVLLDAGVDTFYYPEQSVPGRVIDDEMRTGVSGFDRVLLITSRTSPTRPGWVFELRRALEREQATGQGTTVLVVASIDDAFENQAWPADIEPLRQRLLGRTYARFGKQLDNEDDFLRAVGRLLEGLRRDGADELP